MAQQTDEIKDMPGRLWMIRGIRTLGVILTIGGIYGFVSTFMHLSSGFLSATFLGAQLDISAVFALIAGIGVFRLRESGRIRLLILAWLHLLVVLIFTVLSINEGGYLINLRLGSFERELSTPVAFGVAILCVVALDIALITFFSKRKVKNIFVEEKRTGKP